jgi:putative mycofactocin binding protein MftB
MPPAAVRQRTHHPRAHATINTDRACYLDYQVVIRPATDGGLAYHFGTSRAVAFKPRELAEFLAGLGGHPTLRAALDSVALAPEERSAWEDSLAWLARAGVIRFR